MRLHRRLVDIALEEDVGIRRFGTGATSLTQLKANAVQIFKTKGVTSFKTV